MSCTHWGKASGSFEGGGSLVLMALALLTVGTSAAVEGTAGAAVEDLDFLGRGTADWASWGIGSFGTSVVAPGVTGPAVGVEVD